VTAGRFKLATLVQYVPLPVVGGYLGYVGYFCLAAGVALACNVQVLLHRKHPACLHALIVT
jgi:SulP family sulfate permease